MEQKIESMERFRARMETVRTYIATGKYMEGIIDDNQKRTIRKNASTHVLQNNTLYYIGAGNKKKEVIMSAEKAQEIIRQRHLGPMGSHRGIGATFNKVARHYRWKGVKKDVVEYVKACEICQKQRNQAESHFRRHHLWTEPDKISEMEMPAFEVVEDIPSDSPKSGPSKNAHHKESGNLDKVHLILDSNSQDLNVDCISRVDLCGDTDKETDRMFIPTNHCRHEQPADNEDLHDCNVGCIDSEHVCFEENSGPGDMHCLNLGSVLQENTIPLNMDYGAYENVLHLQDIETTCEKLSQSEVPECVPKMFDASTQWTDFSQQDHSYTKLGNQRAGDERDQDSVEADDDSQRPADAPPPLPSITGQNDAQRLYTLCLKQARKRCQWVNSFASGIVSSQSAEGTEPPVAALSGKDSGLSGGCVPSPAQNQTCAASKSSAPEENIDQMWLHWLKSELKNNEVQRKVMMQQLKFMKQQETLYCLRMRELSLRIKRLEQQ